LNDGDVVALELPSDVKPEKPIKPANQANKTLGDKSAVGVTDGARPTTAVQPAAKKAVL
jgi:hypothetical protein